MAKGYLSNEIIGIDITCDFINVSSFSTQKQKWTKLNVNLSCIPAMSLIEDASFKYLYTTHTTAIDTKNNILHLRQYYRLFVIDLKHKSSNICDEIKF